jgi:IclR family acetate operon transcriptional repressor
MQSHYWVPILGAAARILDVFYESDSDLTLHQVSTAAKVGKTSAFRILYTLDKLGYVEKVPGSGHYRLGLRIAAAAQKAIASGNLLQIAHPYLKKLRDEFQETINLAAMERSRIVYLEILESPHPFRLAETVGAYIPWHSTALGKSIAAFLPEDQVKAALTRAPLRRSTPNTITSVRKFIEILAEVRHQGYSVDHEESVLGATCVAAPIFDGGDGVLGAVSLSGPTPRVQDKQKRVVAALRKAAATISRSFEHARTNRDS